MDVSAITRELSDLRCRVERLEATQIATAATDVLDTSAGLYLHSVRASEPVYEPDVYRSYTSEDVRLLRRFAVAERPARGAFTDFLGRITDCSLVPSIRHLEGKASSTVPVPGDGFHADTIEYLGLLRAFEEVGRNAITVAEIGAGWAPWCAAAGVIARRRGLAADLVAIEASLAKLRLAKKHFIDNGLRPDSDADDCELFGIRTRCIHAALWTEDADVRFPRVAEADYGGAVVTSAAASDDRFETVAAMRLETALGAYPIIDFLHIDIHGSEAAVCAASIGHLQQCARYVFVSTHSRSIEGDLMTTFRTAGFAALREKPSRVDLGEWVGTLERMTTAAGGLLFRNPAVS
ncbi:MAG: hypothetical protein JOY70_03135 [Acidisphaera sp.]|nr:hypothetical protein [Acidisphaera sp.]